MKKKQYISLLIYIFISSIILTGCTPKKNDIVKPVEENRVVADENTRIRKSENNEIIKTKDNTQKTFKIEEIEEQKFKNSYTIGSQKYLSLLPLIPGQSVLPEDFRIGKLYDNGDATHDAALIGRTISDFFSSMKKKTIKRSLLYQEKGSQEGEPGNRGFELYRLLTFHLESNNIPREYRIGGITIEETDTAYAIVRLFGKKGTTNGEVYLIKEQKKWYISDMQINFYDLEIPDEKNKEKFMPTTYHWIIQGM